MSRTITMQGFILTATIAAKKFSRLDANCGRTDRRMDGKLSPYNHLAKSRCDKNRILAYAKTKAQISFAVTAKLICAFVFTTRIVQPLYFLNPKFQAASHLLWLSSSVCFAPGRKPRRPVFSPRGSNYVCRISELHSV